MIGYSDNNGFIERKKSGRYEGNIIIDGVDISPIEGVYFMEQNKHYLWLKRKPILDYDTQTMSYRTRERQPKWEVYLQKQTQDNITYIGEFIFLHFKYKIVGFWDDVLGEDKQRLNLCVERLPMSQQTIINGINQRNKINNDNTNK